MELRLEPLHMVPICTVVELQLSDSSGSHVVVDIPGLGLRAVHPESVSKFAHEVGDRISIMCHLDGRLTFRPALASGGQPHG